MNTTLTFDQMERDADRTLALVLWAKYVKNMALAAVGMAALRQLAKSLVKSLSREDKLLASLSDEQATELAKKLQGVYSQLDFLLRRNVVVQWRSNRLFAGSLNGIADSTEDLADIIEDLILSTNPKFRSVLVECVKALPINSAELVGHV